MGPSWPPKDNRVTVFWEKRAKKLFLRIFRRFFLLLGTPGPTCDWLAGDVGACRLPRHTSKLASDRGARSVLGLYLIRALNVSQRQVISTCFQPTYGQHKKRHKYAMVFKNNFLIVRMCSLVSRVTFHAMLCRFVAVAKIRDGSERCQFSFFSEKNSPKFRKIQSLTKFVRLWQFGSGRFFVAMHSPLRRGNVRSRGFPIWEKIDFSRDFFTPKIASHNATSFFSRKHISEAKCVQDQLPMA